MPFACERLIIDAQCAGGVIAGEIKKVSAALNVEHQHAEDTRGTSRAQAHKDATNLIYTHSMP